METIIRVICWAFTCFWIIRTVIDTVRTYLRAKRDGIIKICINPRAALIVLIAFGIMLTGIYIAFGKASDAQKSKEQWEQMRDTEYSEYYMEYYNEQFAKSSGTRITDFGKFVEQQIRAYSSRSYLFTYTGAASAVMALFLLLSGFEKVFYITENGCISRLLKEPEALTAECYGGKIKFYFKSVPDRAKPLISFKATAENLAALGGFIEKEEEKEDALRDSDID